MDRDEAMRLLQSGPEGVKEWNRRRWEGEVIPELSSTELYKAELSDAHLIGANLSGANLNNTNLSGANLSGANLSGANLSGANLNSANLNTAKLNSANLNSANLNSAKLNGADLSNAICDTTVFAYVDLSKVKGLDSVQHFGPSTLGTDSLILSHGRIPEVFLRGCGLTDAWITYLPSLIGSSQPIQLHSCFISYSSKDDPFARRLHGRMRQADLRVWFAPEDMKGGRFIEDQIDRAINLHDKLLLVLTRASMGSNWVRQEIKKALSREKHEKRRMLFPIRLCSLKAIGEWVCLDADTGRDFAEEVRRYHILDFSGWKTEDEFEAAFGKLLDDLKADEPAGPGAGLS
jgi:uncharacterized protein YjbI with pentapeptide repeats